MRKAFLSPIWYQYTLNPVNPLPITDISIRLLIYLLQCLTHFSDFRLELVILFGDEVVDHYEKLTKINPSTFVHSWKWLCTTSFLSSFNTIHRRQRQRPMGQPPGNIYHLASIRIHSTIVGRLQVIHCALKAGRERRGEL